MRSDDDPELLRQRESRVKFFVGNSKRAFVSQENLETAQSALHDLFEIALGFIVITRHAHVKREVARAVALRFAKPELECFERFLISRRTNHFDEGGRSANQRGATRRFMR